MTSTDVVYQRRLAAITHAGEIGNIAEAARVFGVARQTLHDWIDTAKRYGLSALVPKARRRPTQPNEMAAHKVEGILAEAIARPTLGAGRLLEHLAERGIHRSKSGVQKVLNRHGLGTRAARFMALAALTAATTGVVTRQVEPAGFCHFAASAGDLVGLDDFYVGRLKGIGPVGQLTAIDTHTRWVIAELYVGKLTSTHTIEFLDLVIERLAAIDIELHRIVTDNRPQFISRPFPDHLAATGIDHTRTPPRSPDHSAGANGYKAPSCKGSTDPPSTATTSGRRRAVSQRCRVTGVASIAVGGVRCGCWSSPTSWPRPSSSSSRTGPSPELT